MNFNFRDATRAQAKASILIEGLSGKGKSGLALLIAYALTNDWSKVYALDTENKSLDLFQGVNSSLGVPYGTFKKFDLTPYTPGAYAPSNYLGARDAAIAAGAEAFINDSLTHMWTMTGGVLDLVTAAQANMRNQAAAWGDEKVVEEKQKIYATARDSRIHVISTVRIKEKIGMESEDGKTKVVSLGDQQIMMPDFKYEPDLVLRMVHAGNQNGTPPRARVIKSRYAIFADDTEYDFTEALLKDLVKYLGEGVDPAELLERQRLEIIAEITQLLDADVSKKTMFPMLKEQQGVKDVRLKDMELPVLRTLLGILYA